MSTILLENQLESVLEELGTMRKDAKRHEAVTRDLKKEIELLTKGLIGLSIRTQDDDLLQDIYGQELKLPQGEKVSYLSKPNENLIPDDWREVGLAIQEWRRKNKPEGTDDYLNFFDSILSYNDKGTIKSTQKDLFWKNLVLYHFQAKVMGCNNPLISQLEREKNRQ